MQNDKSLEKIIRVDNPEQEHDEFLKDHQGQ